MDNQNMVVEDDENDNYFKKDGSPSLEDMFGMNIEDGVAKLDDFLAYCSEKLLNLDMFLMQVAGSANDFDTLNLKDVDVSDDLIEKVFELDVLCEFGSMEVKELGSIMKFIRTELDDAQRAFAYDGILLNSVAKVGEKCSEAEDYVKRLEEFLVSILKQSVEVKRAVGVCPDETYPDEGKEVKNGNLSSTPEPDWKMLASVQQRHVLEELEKSLARELDFEKKLSDSKLYGEELKLKLYYAERELYYMEESIEICLERMFTAENTAQLLLSISKELAANGRLKSSYKKANLPNENDLEKVTSAEVSDEKEISSQSKFTRIQNVIEDLNVQKSINKNRAENAGINLTELNTTNMACTQELDLIRKGEEEKVNEKTSTEGNNEHKNVFHDEIADMGNIIEDLKRKLSQAESKAQCVESECTLLSETNMELAEEIALLKVRLVSMEATLNQAENAKVSAAKDIGIRTKSITDMVMRLALERENLHLQVSALIRKNKVLTKKFKRKENSPVSSSSKGPDDETVGSPKWSNEALTEPSVTDAQVANSARDMAGGMGVETTISEEDSAGSDSRSEVVRIIDAAQLGPKFLFFVTVIFFLSALTFYMYQLNSELA